MTFGIVSRLSLVFLFLIGFARMVEAQVVSPFAGFYVGTMSIEISGSVSMPERAVGPVAFTIRQDGAISSSGDLSGTVSMAGEISWIQPNAGRFTTGNVTNGVITSSGSQTTNGVTTTFRVRASNTAPGYSGNSPLAGRVEQVNPDFNASDLVRVRFLNGRFVAAGQRGTIAYSDDGLTWRRVGLATTMSLLDVAFGNGVYVAVGEAGTVFTSPDLLTWTARSSGLSAFTGVAFGNGKFMRSSFVGELSVSTDGAGWAPAGIAGATGAGYAGLDFVNGQFASYNGNVVFTADGSAVAATGTPTVGNIVLSTANASKIAFGNGVYVVGGQNGLSYSANGTTWTAATGPSVRVDVVTFGNGLFVVMDSAKVVWISENGTQWEQTGKLANGVSSIAYANGRFVAVGEVLYTSVEGRTWFSPQDDAMRFDATAIYAQTSGGFGSVVIYNEQSSSTDPQGGPAEPASVQGIHRPRTSPVANLWFGDNGYIYYYAGNPAFVTNAIGVAPKLTDHTLRAAAAGRNQGVDSVFIGGDAGTMIRAYRTNAQFGPTFELLPAVTTADLLSATWDYYSGNGTFFVGTGGTIVRINSSGVVSTVNSGTTATLRHVQTFASDEGVEINQKTIAVGDEGTILTTTDGTTWTKRNSGTTARLVGVGYFVISPTQGKYIAAGEDGTTVQSSDGITWTPNARMPVAHRLTRFGNWGRTMVGAGDRGEYFQLAFGANDKVYFTQHYWNEGLANGAALGNGRWVVVGGSTVGVSTDAREWEFRRAGRQLNAVVFAQGKFVAVGVNVVGNSIDGVNWQFKTNASVAWEAITYADGKFVAVGGSSVTVSTDGVTWTTKALVNVGTRLTGVTYGNGKFVTTGWDSRGAYSTDGETWTPVGTSGQTQQSVAFGNGRFASVGTDGRTTYSEDGTFWASQRLNAPTTPEVRPAFTRVIFADGLFHAGTLNGQLYTSTNAVNWTIVHTGITKPVNALAAGNGMLLLGGGQELHTVLLPDNGPVITANPADTTVTEGGMLTLTAGVSGGELSYTWMKNGAPLSNSDRISGANSPALRITGVVPGDAGAYSLLVANGRGSRVSASAIVEVSNQPAGGFDAWAATLPEGQRGENDDPDGDGVVNIAEYAFGTSGASQDGSKPAGLTVNVQGQIYPAVQFTRNTTATGVSIQVVGSTNVTFTTTDPVVESVEPLGDGLERVTVRAANAQGAFFFKVMAMKN